MIAYLQDFFKYFNGRDFFDILIVSIVIYRIILLIKGTRAVQMLVGLAFIFVSFVGAQLFELHTLYWILNNFLSSIIIVIVILFQHDIRRALTQFGKNPFFFFSRESFEITDEILKAAKRLSQRQIGALIVIERETGLKDWSEKGVKVDASVNADILESVFMPGGPIHDGAVIIQKGRIAAAGCYLPLSQEESISKKFGTRHRAALGISERTDAVVMVVSEEIGTISLAVLGKLTTYEDEEDLKKTLITLLE